MKTVGSSGAMPPWEAEMVLMKEGRFSVGASLEENAAIAAVLKKEFPVFAEAVVPASGGKPVPLVYLDSAATAQKPLAVIETLDDFYRRRSANVHRGIHSLGEEATRRYEASRSMVASYLGAGSEREIIFTRGTTESINLVARTLGETFRSGDEIVTTVMEHHANLVPWQQLAERRGVILRFVPVDDDGNLDLVAYEALLGPKTRLVALSAASNVLGTVNPVKVMAELAHRAGALVLVDAAQALPRSKLDVEDLGLDFLAFSGHKAYGPFGIGVLWAREALLEAMPPFMGGGEMIGEVTLEGFSVNELPYKFEAGTPPIAEAVGLAPALDWLDGVDPVALGAYESALARRAVEGLRNIPGLRVLGNPAERAGIVAFVAENVHAHDLSAYLDRFGIAVRAGHHCAHPLARRFGVVSSARASFGAYSLPEDVDYLISKVAEAMEVL